MLNTEYMCSLDDEIISDVYYYHNKINEKLDIYTIGCEVSEWDGEKIARNLNLDDLDKEIIIINTCAVTENAQKASEKIVERLSNIYKNKKIYITGCGVDYNFDFYNKYGIALNNSEKFKAANYGTRKNDKQSRYIKNIHRDVGTVKIEDGCYNNCAYCVIHKIRPHYMMPYSKIKEEITELIKQGKRNIQLIGTEISSYYSDNMHLTELCEKIIEDFNDIDNIVIGAIDPASQEVFKLIELMKKEPKIYNNLYLCTQSCSDTILKSMNRRHNVAKLREISHAAGKDVHLVFQLIVGFPGETDELFNETLDVIKELKPVDFDTIPFSARIGTAAYDMPNKVSSNIIKKREQIIYDTVKSYTKNNDFGTERSFASFEKNNFDKFNVYKPKELSDSIIFNKDLYNTNDLYELFETLSQYNNEKKDIVIVTDYNINKDKSDLDVNIKLLTMNFGVKVIIKIKVNDEILHYIINEPSNKFNFNLANFSYRMSSFLEFTFDKLETSSEEDVIKLFKIVQENNLDDIDNMALNLISAGNLKFFDVIKKQFDVTV